MELSAVLTRYRGYYHDAETGLYYLNSRYYNPEFGRFISPDVFVSTGQGLTGANMFAYCGNNPVMYSDPSGTAPLIPQEVIDATKKVVETILGILFYVKGGTNAKGQYYEYWLDEENRLKWTRHNSDHGNPSKHNNPHDHSVIKDDDGNDTLGPPKPPNPGFQAPESNKQRRDDILPAIGLFGVATTAGFGLAGVFGSFGGSGHSVGISLGGNFSPFTICIMYAQ